MKTAAIILAAGKGTRMVSALPKVMHNIAGLPMITHVIRTCKAADIQTIIPVIGPDMDDLAAEVAPHHTVIQHDRLGTGDAAKTAWQALQDFDGYVFILNGDGPFIRPETLQGLYEKAKETGLAVLGFEAENPHGYGRLVLDGHYVSKIIEEKDCNDDQRQITLCNAGAYCVDGSRLFGWLDRIGNDNAQGEYYLTDLVAIAAQDRVHCAYAVAAESETLGINSRAQLAQAEAIIQHSLRDKAMAAGVTMIDPASVFLSMDTVFGQDIVIEPNVVIGPGVSVGSGTVIKGFSHIEGTEIGENCKIGPFARLRPKSKLHDRAEVGNFVEVNRSEVKSGAKSKHVSYLGDSVIGEKANIGAGTIIANYDGFHKHITTVGEGVFVGSNSTLVSPVQIADGAIIAAGSVINESVERDALAIARSRQENKPGRAKAYRERNKKDEE